MARRSGGSSVTSSWLRWLPTSTTDLDRALEQLTDSGLAFRRGTPPEAHYTFKHALVQDAAYDSLLKSRRQALHATIARVLAANFPQTTASEPELLAHHLTAAGQAAAAIPFWQQAGELALKRLALKEAIAHLNQGIETIGTLPPSPERDGQELNLRTPLGMAWLALKGWGAPEVWTSLHPALGLAKSFGRHDALLPIYWGLLCMCWSRGASLNPLTGSMKYWRLLRPVAIWICCSWRTGWHARPTIGGEI